MAIDMNTSTNHIKLIRGNGKNSLTDVYMGDCLISRINISFISNELLAKRSCISSLYGMKNDNHCGPVGVVA